MTPLQIVESARSKLTAATEHLKDESKKLRTGRAHPAMLDNVIVEAYGQNMPLKSLASVMAPEAQLLQITPFDPNNLAAIAESIRNDQTLGLTPTDDGRVVRINLPPLTSEDREKMVKVLHQKAEEALVAARQARHEAREALEAAEKAKTIGRDELTRYQTQVDDALAKQKAEVEALAQAKEQEILNV